MKPGRLIFIAFIMVLLGAVLPFLIVIRVLESTWWLNFLAYGFSVGGLFLGIIGAGDYVRDRHWRNKTIDAGMGRVGDGPGRNK
jgi:hypothetical protein